MWRARVALWHVIVRAASPCLRRRRLTAPQPALPQALSVLRGWHAAAGRHSAFCLAVDDLAADAAAAATVHRSAERAAQEACKRAAELERDGLPAQPAHSLAAGAEWWGLSGASEVVLSSAVAATRALAWHWSLTASFLMVASSSGGGGAPVFLRPPLQLQLPPAATPLEPAAASELRAAAGALAVAGAELAVAGAELAAASSSGGAAGGDGACAPAPRAGCFARPPPWLTLAQCRLAERWRR